MPIVERESTNVVSSCDCHSLTPRSAVIFEPRLVGRVEWLAAVENVLSSGPVRAAKAVTLPLTTSAEIVPGFPEMTSCMIHGEDGETCIAATALYV